MPTQDQTVRLQVQGKYREADKPTVPPDFAHLLHERQVAALDIRPVSRGGEHPPETLQARPDDLLELELDNGLRLYMTVEEYGKAASATTRGEAEETPAVVKVTPDLPGLDRERGPLKLAVNGLKVIGVDVVAGASGKIAATIDEKKGLNGLYGFPLSAAKLTLEPRTKDAPFPTESGPLLIFIHGTMSSTEGSFGGLWGESDAIRARLAAKYGSRVFAFEHKTFTESPIDNAVALVDVLPDNAVLHLVSHSRGGMVGELLCRAGRVKDDGSCIPAFDDDDLALFRAPDQQGKLRQLQALLAKKRLVIDRFVRVACPARGTTLASGRMDRYLSVLQNGLSVLDKSGWGADVVWLLTSVVKERTDPKVMPGIAEMMPDSPTVGLLNRPDVTVTSDLHVIAGDYDGDGILGRMANWASEAFYGGENDVVVNTPSMYGGASRTARKGWYFFAQGPQVWHFSYFKQNNTASKLADALLLDDPVAAGFRPISEAPGREEPIARGLVGGLIADEFGAKLVEAKPSPTGSKPVLVLVPGIMGSHLKAGKDRIWVDIFDIAKGEFSKLAMGSSDVTNDGMVRMAYGDFFKFASASHEVLPFPYDWRISLAREGSRFSMFMKEVLDITEQNRRPVRILAHSMGGLLVRMAAMLKKEEGGTDWWSRLKGRNGSRLVMAGTPNGGSWMVPLAITGRADIVKTLATADLKHDRNQIIDIIRNFDGFLEMLPAEAPEVFEPAVWKGWRVAGEDWPLPDPALLAKSNGSRGMLERFRFDEEKDVVRYVAGRADETPLAPSAAELKNGKLVFGSTPRGDGRVLWDTGIPEGVQVWYMEAAHGDLLNKADKFDALVEIVSMGSTTLLSTKEPLPQQRGPEPKEKPFPERPVPMYPDRGLLISTALGARPEVAGRRVRAAEDITFRVSVCHGNLAAARFPVVVGHYFGDTINGSEAALDRRLKGVLKRTHRLGIYPGACNTSEIFTDGGDWTAIIVGLGQVGELTPARLSAGFAQALLRYATTCKPRKDGGFCISALLIGSGTGWGLGVKDSVRALIEGARRANVMLAEVDGGLNRLKELEFLELYEDPALQALTAIRDLSQFGILNSVELVPALRKGRGGRCRAMSDDSAGWWNRMKVEVNEADELKFTTLTGLARVEESVQATQRTLVDKLIRAAVTDSSIDEKQMVAIYNLVTPNALKDRAPDQSDLLVMVDKEAARYPWEMMHVGEGEKKRAIALEAGFVRQLSLGTFRERPAYSTGQRALVVAEPQLPSQSGFPPLSGAREEGTSVRDKLQAGNVKVTERFGATSRDIITALFDGEYRILHLAGHGVYKWPRYRRASDCTIVKTEATGMVIDWMTEETRICDGVRTVCEGVKQAGLPVLLTAVEVRQMQKVPELVFINCCHLGEMEKSSDRRVSDRNLMAASFAAEFIEMGVRAVIAAGWAVNDAAAKAFSEKFYDAMQGGLPFGEAVLSARRAAQSAAPGSNTWAAYQCYGDPDYRFRENQVKERPKVYLTPREALYDIQAVAATDYDDSGARPTTVELKAALDKIVSLLPHEWYTGNGAIRDALGDGYAGLCQYDAAIEHYRVAVGCDDGTSSLHAIEQLANFQVRRADERWSETEPETAEAEIAKVIAWFSQFVSLCGPTPERLGILASAQKKMIVAHLHGAEVSDAKVQQHLEAMKDGYRGGARLDGDLDVYNALNWVMIEVVDMCRNKVDEKLVETLKEVVDQAREKGTKLQQENPEFWNRIYTIDADLCRWLLSHLEEHPAPSTITPEALGQQYTLIIQSYGSAREADSVRKQFEFLLQVLPDNKRKAVVDMRKGLKRLAETVTPPPASL